MCPEPWAWNHGDRASVCASSGFLSALRGRIILQPRVEPTPGIPRGGHGNCHGSKTPPALSQKGPWKPDFPHRGRPHLAPSQSRRALRAQHLGALRGPTFPLPGPAPHPHQGQRAHMRPLGGILRPSRNQVTCGRGKLAMRGARTTAASPWATLWCFSLSSKLPMSAGGKGTWRGQGSEVGSQDCPAPGLGVAAAEGSCGADRMIVGPGRHARATSRGPIAPSVTTTCSALYFWGLYPFTSICPRSNGFIQQP